MSNEIFLNINLAYTKGSIKETIANSGVNINVSGTKYVRAIQNIGTTAEVLSIGDVGTAGYCVLHNIDPTNFVQFSSDGVNHLIKLKAGEWSVIRLSGSTIFGKANTAACNVEYFVVED